MTKKYRIEKDCLGEMKINDDNYYGIQTSRMMKVSGCAGLPVIFYPDMHRALAQIKKAAALANSEIGVLSKDIAEAIVQACDEVIAGKLDSEFPLDMWQGGGYTCINMNINEVIGNRANEIMTGHKGQDKVHPNTHVNMGQSTNDTIPSATHLGIAPWIQKISKELDLLAASFDRKEKEFRKVVKVGRTCWQDALPLTLGQEFGGYCSLMKRLSKKLSKLEGGCFELVMGGSAVGTGFGSAPGYMSALYKYLSKQYHTKVYPMKDLFDGFQNCDFLVSVSSTVKEIACSLSKISKDLRLMSSGPRCGFLEIQLPALSPGSSIMPGKINPTVPEMVIQIAHQVIGNDFAITVAYDEGELDLDVWDATYYKCLFENLKLVESELKIFREFCIDGIRANIDRCKLEAESSIALSTIVASALGYPLGVRVAHYCEKYNCSVKEAVIKMKIMTEEEANTLVDPLLMTDQEKLSKAVEEFKVKHKIHF